MAIELAFGPLIRLLGPSPELQAFATSYAHGRLLGGPAIVAAVVLTSFFRGLGDTRTPLVATVVANLLNAVACYGLVFGRFGLPAWGVAGAGVATALRTTRVPLSCRRAMAKYIALNTRSATGSGLPRREASGAVLSSSSG